MSFVNKEREGHTHLEHAVGLGERERLRVALVALVQISGQATELFKNREKREKSSQD